MSGAETARPLLDVNGLAAYLNVNVGYIRRLVHERRVPFHKIGKFVRFDPDDIDRWVRAQRAEP